MIGVRQIECISTYTSVHAHAQVKLIEGLGTRRWRIQYLPNDNAGTRVSSVSTVVGLQTNAAFFLSVTDMKGLCVVGVRHSLVQTL